MLHLYSFTPSLHRMLTFFFFSYITFQLDTVTTHMLKKTFKMLFIIQWIYFLNDSCCNSIRTVMVVYYFFGISLLLVPSEEFILERTRFVQDDKTSDAVIDFILFMTENLSQLQLFANLD